MQGAVRLVLWIAHDEAISPIHDLSGEVIGVTLVPGAGFEIPGQLGDSAIDERLVELCQSRDASADLRLQVALGPAPIRRQKSGAAVMRNPDRFHSGRSDPRRDLIDPRGQGLLGGEPRAASIWLEILASGR